MPYTKKTTTAPKKDAINKETDTKVTNTLFKRYLPIPTFHAKI